MTIDNKRIRDLCVVFFFALLLRIVYVLFTRQFYFFYHHPSSDVMYYQHWAQELARTNFVGLRVFSGLPLYPYFLAVLYRLFLASVPLIRFAHLVLGAVNCLLVYLISAQLFGRKVAMGSALLVAAHFSFIYYDCLMMPVGLNIFFSLLIVLFVLRSNQLQTKRSMFFLGLVIGLACLGDGKMILFLVFLVLKFLHGCLFKKSYKRQCFRVMCFVIGFWVIMISVGLRNWIVSGEWVWISAQKGLSLYVGNNINAKGYYKHPDFLRPDHHGQDEDMVLNVSRALNHPVSVKQASQYWQDQAFIYIRQHPKGFFKLLGKKFSLFFTDTQEAYDLDLILQGEWKNRLEWNHFWIIFPLGGLGLYFARKKKGVLMIAVLIVCQLLFTLVFFLQHRHRMTIIPFFIMFEVFAFLEIYQSVRKREWKLPILACVPICLYIVIFPTQKISGQMLEYIHATKAGNVYEGRQDFLQAKKSYQKALRIHPQDTNALYNLANVHFSLGDTNEAVRLYQKVLRINPYHADALYNLAFLYKMTGSTENALEVFLTLHQWQPQSPDVNLQLILIYRSQDNCAETLNYYHFLKHKNVNLGEELEIFIKSCTDNGF
ncbi:MAG: tetratricopeptide repeat protein [Candidatus Omnitrophica bacterium]|nr:tetratricopeptide repeat protein [Candidatus Omnitrophota bacterium]